jgi:hypothetical protein
LTPGIISEKVVARRAALVEEMLLGLRALPLDSYERFVSDSRAGRES